MIQIFVNMPSDGTVYVPAPARGVVVGLKGSWNTDVVEPGDTIIAYRESTAVCTLTAVNTAGIVQETGVRDATYMDIVFDPAIPAYSVIKLVANGSAGIAMVIIEFDQYVTVKETPLEASV